MSYCASYGKDKVMFLTKEDLQGPSSIELPEDNEPRGPVLPNGEINWSCPCLGNMVVGPCNVEFRNSLSCFMKSTEDPKGKDCIEHFRAVNDCLNKYPKIYKKNEEADAALRSLEDKEFPPPDEEEDETDLNGTTVETGVSEK